MFEERRQQVGKSCSSLSFRTAFVSVITRMFWNVSSNFSEPPLTFPVFVTLFVTFILARYF